MKLISIPKRPIAYLDVIKLFAILMVVFNHSGGSGYKLYVEVMNEPVHSMLMAFSALIKIAVPLFFMASGALMLRREESFGKILTKRVLKFVFVLLAVSFVFYYDSHAAKEPLSVQDFCIHVLKNDLSVHLWYLYSYICYLLMLPFLQKLAKQMRTQDYLLMIVIYQVMQLLPVMDYAIFKGSAVHTSYISFFMAETYVVYPLLGYWIDSCGEEEDREETIYILVFLSILSIAATCALTQWRYSLDGAWTNANTEAYMGRLSVIPAITVFYAMKKLFTARPVTMRTAKVLFVLGSCTFGVYLFDPKWRYFTQQIRWSLTPVIGSYFASHVQTLCACILGLAVTFVYKCAVGVITLAARKLRAAHD